MENFNRFLIRLQKFDVKTLKDVLPIPGYGMDVPLGEREYGVHYNIKHEVPEYNQKFRSQMEELMEMAMTDLLNLDIHRINFHLKRLFEIDRNILEALEKYNEIIVDPRKGNIERRRDVFSLQLERKFNAVGLDRGESSTRIPSDFLLDISLALGYRSVCIRKFIKQVNDIIQTDDTIANDQKKGHIVIEEEAIASSLSNEEVQKNYGYPVFKKMYIDDIFSALEEHFKGTETELRMLLESGNAESVVCVFNGRCNQLCDLFIKMSGRNLIVSCEKGELMKWICSHFRYREKGNIKKCIYSNVRKLFGMQIRTKNPLYTIEFSEDEDKFLFIPCH